MNTDTNLLLCLEKIKKSNDNVELKHLTEELTDILFKKQILNQTPDK